MKLIRFGPPTAEKPGFIDPQGQRRDCSTLVSDWDRTYFQTHGRDAMQAMQAQWQDLPVVEDSERWASPIARPGKVLCIGLNYREHAAESGLEIPPEPVIFMKAANTVIGPYDPVWIPRGSQKTDWEVELAVVLGKDARYLKDEAEAMAHVAGYCISNDVSEREFQLERQGQWTKGKSCDHFNPLGPWLATADEIPDPQDLHLECRVNQRIMQKAHTGDMAFSVAAIVLYLSQFMTLEAGDLINTGTPSGVGLGQDPPLYLKAGDQMELSIDHLGCQQQSCEEA
ncbi:MAG: FAA hydrolase family protein [Planctomycetota bacterium]|nr:MAG: FAA hydrolase family protein [Planctomycetota bacterium]